MSHPPIPLISLTSRTATRPVVNPTKRNKQQKDEINYKEYIKNIQGKNKTKILMFSFTFGKSQGGEG